MDELNKFHERLAALIEESGATHDQVARWMDVSRVAVTNWTLGNTEPRAPENNGAARSDAIARLSEFFGCPPEWLYFGRGKRPSTSTLVTAVHDAIAKLGPKPPKRAKQPKRSEAA